jgi:hypothetical protein
MATTMTDSVGRMTEVEASEIVTDRTAARKAELRGRLATITAELLAMPAGKLGSPWHEARCREAQALAGRLEMLAK